MPAMLLVDSKKGASLDTTTEAPHPQPAPAPAPAPAQSGRPSNRVSDEVSFLRELELLPEDGGAVSITGAWWKGSESYNKALTPYLWFRDDGTLHYGHNKSNSSVTISEWKQRGNTVYLALNNRYSEWLLTIEGNTMTGRAQNCVQFKWTMEFAREG